MYRHLVILIFAICFISETALGKTIVVPKDYSTIQAAIDQSENGDQILVMIGLYQENIDFCGKAVTVISDSGPKQTFINGMKTGSVVTFKNNEGPDSMLIGFTLMKGSGAVDGHYTLGGGIYCEGASPTLTHNIITENSVYGVGGGIYCKNASPKITDCVISKNIAEWKGGGIFCDESAPEIMRNIIVENCTTDGFGSSGGGVCCWNSSNAVISHNLIKKNIATGFFGGTGGGIRSSNSSPLINNNIIIENSADSGGGVYCNNKHVKLINNTIAWNTAFDCGGGVVFKGAPLMEIVNTILWCNSAIFGPEIWVGNAALPACVSINYSLISNGAKSVFMESMCSMDWGIGVIESDPIFVDSLSHDIHLTAHSPCIDAGLDMTSSSSDSDVEGDPRISSSNPDIGADEFYKHLYCTGDITPGGFIEIKLIDKPGRSPVILWIGSGILNNPITTKYGDWMLDLPIKSTLVFSSIGKNGVLKIKKRISKNSKNSKIPIQAFICREFTNHCMIEMSKAPSSGNEGQ